MIVIIINSIFLSLIFLLICCDGFRRRYTLTFIRRDKCVNEVNLSLKRNLFIRGRKEVLGSYFFKDGNILINIAYIYKTRKILFYKNFKKNLFATIEHEAIHGCIGEEMDEFYINMVYDFRRSFKEGGFFLKAKIILESIGFRFKNEAEEMMIDTLIDSKVKGENVIRI